MRYLFDSLNQHRLLQLLAGSALLYWIALTVVMHIPLELPAEEPGSVITTDKFVHFFLYGGFAAFLITVLEQRARVSPTSFPKTRAGRYFAVLAFCAIHGLIEERTQPWTGRTNDFRDWGTDCLGASLALLGCFTLSCVLPYFRKRESSS